MTNLTRRRSDNTRLETWLIYFGDVQVGTIGVRAGVPKTVDQWGWSCGFYPGMEPGQRRSGIASTFDEARGAFEAAWNEMLPAIPNEAFELSRRSTAFTAWKYEMWAAGCRMPAQNTSGRSKCFCGAEIGSDFADHVYSCHMATAA